MIFVTLGSQKFQFDRLLQKIDELADIGFIHEEIFAQTGASGYEPKHYKYKDFLNRDEFVEMIDRSNIVITHGGTGAIIGAIKRNKKVIAVPRLAKFGEHVDDHQIQLLKQFEEMKIIETCYNLDKLDEAIMNLDRATFTAYVSNTQQIIDSIDGFLKENIKGK